MNEFNLEFYRGKRVFVTGHTGFKGTWMSKVLLMHGANVVGYAMEPPTQPGIFSLLSMEKQMTSVIGDIRDFSHLTHHDVRHAFSIN